MTISKTIEEVFRGSPVSSTYKPKATETVTLLTEMRDETVAVDAPLVAFFWGQSNLEGNTSATDGDHTIINDIYMFDTDMSGGTTVAGTQWLEAEFGVAPLNIGANPYANNAPLHFAQALRKRYHRPVYVICIGKGGTAIEAWITDATLATNSWSRGGAQNLSSLMYPGIANALALVPGAPTTLDYVGGIHGAANQDEQPETYAAKVTALMTELATAGLIDLQTTPIINNELADNDGSPNRFRHYNALIRAQEDLPTLRVVRTAGLPSISTGNIHFSGEGLQQLGYRMEAAAAAAPVRVDYRQEPTRFGPDIGWRHFTNFSNRTYFDPFLRPAHVGSQPLAVVDDASLGWAFSTDANAAYIFWGRRVAPIIPNSVVTVALEAVTTAVGATVDLELSVWQWDVDGVSLGAKNVNYTLTDAMGTTTFTARFGHGGAVADNSFDAGAVYFAYGFTVGAGGDDEACRFNVKDMSVSVLADRYEALTAGTLALDFAAENIKAVTPNANGTFTTTIPPKGTRCDLIITTSGGSSYTMTFGTGFKTTGTLATGTSSGKIFNIAFLSDGTSVNEVSRTTAL